MKRWMLPLALVVLSVVGASQERGASSNKWVTIRATQYSAFFEGREMANGRLYHNYSYTAASRSLPFGTRLLVVNRLTGKSVVVVVTDRGPWHFHFSLDVSRRAGKALGLTDAKGWIWVKYKVLYPCQIELDKNSSIVVRSTSRHVCSRKGE